MDVYSVLETVLHKLWTYSRVSPGILSAEVVCYPHPDASQLVTDLLSNTIATQNIMGFIVWKTLLLSCKSVFFLWCSVRSLFPELWCNSAIKHWENAVFITNKREGLWSFALICSTLSVVIYRYCLCVENLLIYRQINPNKFKLGKKSMYITSQLPNGIQCNSRWMM